MTEAPDLPGAPDETVALAQVLHELGWLTDAPETVEFFAEPWKFEAIHRAWHRFGRPAPVDRLGRYEARAETNQHWRDREQQEQRWEQFRQHTEDLTSVGRA